MKTFLTIAGSDPSGGAGIQADIKTASALGLYAMSVTTALTVQNTLGVRDVFCVPYEIVRKQAETVFLDIFPDCTKIGMCVNSEIIDVISELLKQFKPTCIVLDTVLVSSGGHELLSKNAVSDMKTKLFPLVDVITPNVPEVEYLCGISVASEKDMLIAADMLYSKFGCNVLLKGGHLNGNDLLYCEETQNNGMFFRHKLFDNPNTHGTGCTLSSALAAFLTKYNLEDATRHAIDYIIGAIADGLNLGKGNGPLNHFYNL